MRRRDRQIEIADGSIDGIAQALDHGILQGPCELPLQYHLRQLAPFGRLLELLRRGRVRRAKLYYLRKLSGKKARIKEGARVE